MKFKGPAASVLLIIIIFSMAVYILQTYWQATEEIAEQPFQIIGIEPYYKGKAAEDFNASLIYLPENPAPGDFLLIEGGPLPEDSAYGLSFDFAGSAAAIYHAGGLVYALIAISSDCKPGIYELSLLVDGQSNNENLKIAIDIRDKEFSFSRFSMPADRTAGWTAERLAEDREKIRVARDTSEPYPLWRNSFFLPLEGKITSQFGAVRVINNNPPRRHSGLDIGGPEGTPILATNSGIVRLAEFLLSGGNTVIIDHGMGLSSTYMHLESINVATGEKVEGGKVIGTLGMTGYATGPHLHWEVNIGQYAVNPEQLLDNDLLWVAPAYVNSLLAEEQF